MPRTTLPIAFLLLAFQSAAAQPAPAPGCGYVSTRQGVVPESRDVFAAEITRIDGRSTPPHDVNRHRVAAGPRVLTVGDRIDPDRLPGAAIAQIERMKKLELQRAYKTLTVQVEPGVSYAIGARLLRDRLDAASIRANAYWEPVVWEQRPAACP